MRSNVIRQYKTNINSFSTSFHFSKHYDVFCTTRWHSKSYIANSKPVLLLQTCKFTTESTSATIKQEDHNKKQTPAASFSHTLKALVMEKKWKQAENVWQQMRGLNIYGDVEEYETLANHFDKVGLAQQSKIIRQDIRTIKHNLEQQNAVIGKYVAAIQDYEKQGSLSGMMTTLSEMVGQGIKPDSDVYASFMNVMGMKDDAEQMLKFYKKARESGVKITPEMLNILVFHLGRLGLKSTMYQYYKEITTECFVSPKASTFDVLLLSFGATADIEKLNEIIEAMIRVGCEVPLPILEAIFAHVHKSPHPERLIDLFDLIMKFGMLPDQNILKHLLDYLASAGYKETMIALLHEMRRRKALPEDNFEFCINTANALKKAGDIISAIGYFNRQMHNWTPQLCLDFLSKFAPAEIPTKHHMAYSEVRDQLNDRILKKEKISDTDRGITKAFLEAIYYAEKRKLQSQRLMEEEQQQPHQAPFMHIHKPRGRRLKH